MSKHGVALALVVVLGVAGCYRSHERAGEGADAGGTTRDAGLSARADGGPRLEDAGSMLDSGSDGSTIDAEAPLPRDPPPDPGPDARPSDDPEAEAWEDEPDLDPEQPCCEPLGPPVEIPFAREVIGGLAIAWNGDGWGVLYTNADHRTGFQALDRHGGLLGPIRRYDVGAFGARLVWADGRFAALVMREGEGPRANAFALLDRRGVVDAGWSELGLHGLGADVARLAHLDRWVVVAAASGTLVAGAEVDSRAAVVDRTEIGPMATERAHVVGGLKSRVVVFWPGIEGEASATVYARTLASPIGETAPGPVVELTVPGRYEPIAATRLRDRAVFILNGGLVAYDPFTGDTIVAPHHLLPSEIVRLGHAAVGLDGPGVVATCSGVDSSGERWIELRVFGGQGGLLGDAVRVGEETHPLSAWPCAVAADGDRIFVAWQDWSGPVRVQGFRLRR